VPLSGVEAQKWFLVVKEKKKKDRQIALRSVVVASLAQKNGEEAFRLLHSISLSRSVAGLTL
jgi:hypothetical protein